MKRAILIASGLFMMLIIHACSKSISPTPEPVAPVDSTHIPDDGNGGDDGTGEGEDVDPVAKTYEVFNFPILDATTRNSLFLGAITAKTDNENLIHPEFTTVDDALRNPITIYTDLALDVDAQENVKASKSTDNKFISSIKKQFDKGVGQVPGTVSGSASPFENRFNSLRGLMGVNHDLNELLDLGFADTTKLADDKGRVLLSFEVVKVNMTLQVPIYEPFLSIDDTDKKWTALFGSETPEIVSNITYGELAFMVVESDSGTEKLRLAVDSFLKKSGEANNSGAAFSSLSEEDRKIITDATVYGYSIGKGSFPHEGKAALTHYAELTKKAFDTHDMGEPLYYSLSNLTSSVAFINKFDVDAYPQKARK